MNSTHLQQALQCLGWEFTLSEDVFDTLEYFVCTLYGQSCSSVNEARHRLFCTKALSEHRLAPCRDALFLHSQRANYQAGIWRRALQNWMNVPNPNEHGWVVQGNRIEVRWMTQDQAPPELLKQQACGCKKSTCKNNRCCCFANGVLCTDMCSCVICENTDETVIEIQLINDVSDDDEDD